VQIGAVVFPIMGFIHTKDKQNIMANNKDFSKAIKDCVTLQELADEKYAEFLASHRLASQEVSLLAKKLSCAGIPQDFYEIIDGTMHWIQLVHDSTGPVPGAKVKATPIIPASQKE
jgi:hypothetical protein